MRSLWWFTLLLSSATNSNNCGVFFRFKSAKSCIWEKSKLTHRKEPTIDVSSICSIHRCSSYSMLPKINLVISMVMVVNSTHLYDLRQQTKNKMRLHKRKIFSRKKNKWFKKIFFFDKGHGLSITPSICKLGCTQPHWSSKHNKTKKRSNTSNPQRNWKMHMEMEDQSLDHATIHTG
jgi:hypothetical protein